MTTFPRTHISRYVSSLAATKTFYDQLFGQSPSKERPGYLKYELDQPSLIISFIEQPDRVNASGHFGIQVATREELLARHAKAQSQQLVAREEMGVSCCYAVQDKFWAVDPDGHQWEIYYFHADVKFNDPAYQLAQEDSKAATAAIPIASTTAIDKEACGCGVNADCC